MANDSLLKYADEEDRAYGVAGMTIAMMLWDGEPFLASVNLDNPVGRSIEFTPSFGFSGNPRFMASLAWREHLKQFELISAMIMGNTICRSYVRRSTPLSSDISSALRSFISEEGRQVCSLEDDEIEIIYNKTRRYLDRVFTHSGVTALARNFADTLHHRRQLSAAEVFDILSALNRM